ncbi:MAG: Mur ligase domain-containing protein [Flavobacteriaceae bacterium]|nr:Mur ligase domain-containing protein [Flavobacteriaceae bacterium]
MNIHFIAIGGSAMHNLAIALHNKGQNVTGSDDAIHEPSKSRLAAKNLLPKSFGWFPNKITNKIDAVILGMHAKPDNTELLRAQELDLKIYSYPEFLYAQSKDKIRVVIGGSHGKTTITAMILHVLHYHKKEVDYMVGAQLTGFDTMVHLTQDNKYMLLEGDEYLSSPIDRRPKFHLYKPHIALISGVAWDHINVFPTFDNYLEQFKIFVDSILPNGTIIYNNEDENVKNIVAESTNDLYKIPYQTPKHFIDKGITYLKTPQGDVALAVFGNHNLQNLAGAKCICAQMGLDETAFYKAIAHFKGADKRLQKIAENDSTAIFKDFAHAPSKVIATTNAVKTQYKERRLLACLELHTYSSLNPIFLKQYQHALDAADEAVVFYAPKALAIKQLASISISEIKEAFNRTDLKVFTDPKAFSAYLFEQNLKNTALLLMSSGNYGGLDFKRLCKLV